MPKSKLLDLVSKEVRLWGMSRSTERSYTRWVRRYVLFHGTRHPREMGAEEVRSFLIYLGTDRDVTASTQSGLVRSAPHHQALARKYPNAPKEWPWQYVFPSSQLSTDRRSGARRRLALDSISFDP